MDNATEKRIDDIKSRMQCVKDFECLSKENPIRTRDIGMEHFVECESKNYEICGFALSFGQTYFCKCPIQLCVARKLKK